MTQFLKTPLTISAVVEPVKFFCNTATCADNYFQVNDEVTGDPLSEHRNFVAKLKCVAPGCVASFALSGEERIAPRLEEIIGKKGDITVPNSKERLANMPDAIFPNNSFSVHEVLIGDCGIPCLQDHLVNVSSIGVQGTAVLFVMYPMCSGRRDEIPNSLVQRALNLEGAASAVFSPKWKQNGDLWEVSSWDLECLKESDSSNKSIIPFAVIDMRPFEHIRSLIGPNTVCARESWVFEGTGAVNFMHRLSPTTQRPEVFAYCVASQRAHPVVFHLLGSILGIPPQNRFLFPSAVDQDGKYVYHTNVVGWVGSTVNSGVCGWTFKSLRFQDDESGPESQGLYFAEGQSKPSLFSKKNEFFNHLIEIYGLSPLRLKGNHQANLSLSPSTAAGDGCIELEMDQMHNFAGNSLFIQRESEPTTVLCLSSTAKGALLSNIDVAHQLLKCIAAPNMDEIVFEFPVNEIERLGGGSVRCLVAASTAFTPHGVGKIKALLDIN